MGTLPVEWTTAACWWCERRAFSSSELRPMSIPPVSLQTAPINAPKWDALTCGQGNSTKLGQENVDGVHASETNSFQCSGIFCHAKNLQGRSDGVYRFARAGVAGGSVAWDRELRGLLGGGLTCSSTCGGAGGHPGWSYSESSGRARGGWRRNSGQLQNGACVNRCAASFVL